MANRSESSAKNCKYEKPPVSKLRRAYLARLVGRCVIFVLLVLLWIYRPEQLDVIYRGQFFSRFSALHLLWVLWFIDMLFQLIPVKEHIPLGSQKHFLLRFRPIREKINYQALREYVITTTKLAYKVFLLWTGLLIVIGILYYSHVIDAKVLFMISALFYVCDLICVLIWCPFRLILKNRCCTTCRIFNWDHLMMFTPMLFIPSFYARSLLLMAIAVWLVWELCVMMYPERFWEFSNEALKCSACTDKLCTQYCRKLR